MKNMLDRVPLLILDNKAVNRLLNAFVEHHYFIHNDLIPFVTSMVQR